MPGDFQEELFQVVTRRALGDDPCSRSKAERPQAFEESGGCVFEYQLELVIENATPALLESIGALSISSGARVVAQRAARTDLEKFFLEVTRHRS